MNSFLRSNCNSENSTPKWVWQKAPAVDADESVVKKVKASDVEERLVLKAKRTFGNYVV